MSDAVRSDIGPFAIVPDWIIRSNISDRAVRLFALLARYADRHNVAFPARSTMASDLHRSVDSIDRALRELVDLGAVRIESRTHAAGDRTSNRYHLKLTGPPKVAAQMRPPGRTAAVTGDRKDAGTVAAQMRQRSITTGTTPLGTYERDFEMCFWPAFPRHVARKAALKAYLRIAPDAVLLERMLAALQQQKPAASELRYFPYPATWLNGERWLDESSSNTRSVTGRTGAPAAGKYAHVAERAVPAELVKAS